MSANPIYKPHTHKQTKKERRRERERTLVRKQRVRKTSPSKVFFESLKVFSPKTSLPICFKVYTKLRVPDPNAVLKRKGHVDSPDRGKFWLLVIISFLLTLVFNQEKPAKLPSRSRNIKHAVKVENI